MVTSKCPEIMSIASHMQSELWSTNKMNVFREVWGSPNDSE